MGRFLKILIIVAAVGLILLLIRRALIHRKRMQPGDDPAQQMVQCARCGVHIPLSQAVLDGTQPLCNGENCRTDTPK